MKSSLFQVLALAALIQGCSTSPEMSSSNSRASSRAAAPKVSAAASPTGIVSGTASGIDRYCADILGSAAHVANGESPDLLYERSDTILRSYWAAGAKDATPLAEAVALSCRARKTLSAEERNGVWAWNEHHIGEALLQLGTARNDTRLLGLALAASMNAAARFDAATDGWSWSRYNTGRTAAELFQRDGSATYKATARQAFSDVAATTTPAATYAGQQLAALEG